jgi:serine/threonine protein kinase
MPLDSTYVLPGFEILGPIGRGSTGRVDLARQAGIGRLVALKWLDLLPDGPDRERQIDRLRREAALMGQVSHPNLLTIHALEIAPDGTPGLVLEYIEAGDLRHVLRERGRLTPDEARAILRPVCDAVACLHDHGILHRDLKPENILMHRGVVPKVADFGIARLRDLAPETALPDDHIPSGTMGYVAPEQRFGLEVDERADQFSIAAIAYELLTGEKPLGAYPRPSEVNPQVDDRLDRVVQRALSESPAQRYASLAAFQADLDAALSPAPPAAAPAPDRPPRQRLARWLGLTLLALVALRIATAPQRAPRQVTPQATGAALPPPPAVVVKPSAPRADPLPAETPVQDRLVNLWAYRLWQLQGQPEGEPGRAAAIQNREQAERLVETETARRSKRLWVERGSRLYNDPSLDQAESEQNWHDAQTELLSILEAGAPLNGPNP